MQVVKPINYFNNFQNMFFNLLKQFNKRVKEHTPKSIDEFC